MRRNLRFRLSTLRNLDGEWTVGAEPLDVPWSPGKEAELILLSVDDDVAGWLGAVKEAWLARFDPKLSRPGRAASMFSELYEVDLSEDETPARVLKVHPKVVRAESTSPAPEGEFHAVPAGPPELEKLALEMRAFLEEVVWPNWRRERNDEDEIHPPGSGLAVSQGMCRMSCVCLLPILRQGFPDGNWRIAGGHPSVAYESVRSQFRRAFDGLDGGMWDRANNQWDGHYWLEGEIDGERLIVDVTADQYGWSPVVVTSATDARYRGNYTASTVGKDVSGRFYEKWKVFAWEAWETLGDDVPSPHAGP